MATVGILVHDDYYILVNGVKFTHLTSCTLTLGQETIEITTMDSNGWKDFDVADKEWSMTVEAFYAFDAAENGDEAADDIIAGTTHTVLLTTESTGDTTYTGTAWPTSLDINSSKGSGVTLSVNYQGTAPLTKGVVV